MQASDFSYSARYALLHETKLRQTREKLAAARFMDHDDHGRVPAPADFCWRPEANHPNGSFYGATAWARNFRALMDAHPLYVDPVDALAGRWVTCLYWHRAHPWKPEFDFSHLHADQRRYGIVHGIGAPQHFAPDFSIGFTLGWEGILHRIRAARQRLPRERHEFLDAEEQVVLGIQSLIGRTAAACRARAATEPHAGRRVNLEELAEIHAWIVDQPPRSFREACQWLAWFNVVSRSYNGDGAGTRLDVLLRPYYERDVASGALDDDDATFILACLLLNDPHYYQLGGPDADGRDVTHRLSYLTLEAAHRIGIPCNLTVRVHAGMDEAFFQASIRYLCTDRQGWPRYAGDRGLVDGFMRNGFSAGQARERIAVGCHWMAMPGREYTLNDCVKINVAKVFETALAELLAEPPAATRSVAELWRRFERHLEQAVRCTARGLDFHLAHQADNAPELLISLLCHGPLEHGLDASGGGVEFYNLCVDGSGLATVADSFAAIDQRVEREQELTWDELTHALRTDFAGAAGEHTRLMLRASQHYGQGGDSLGDLWARRVSQLFTRLVTASPTPAGRTLIPGWFSWSNTIPMGRELGATPNGRRAGAPISHGANPDPGFRRDGAPTAMVRAIADVQPGYGNTAPVQMELDPGSVRGDRGAQRVASLIRTHFDLGGTLFNINVLDRETLLEAHRDPARFPDLVVRVTGFSAYFCTLSPAFRQLVVDRMLAETAAA